MKTSSILVFETSDKGLMSSGSLGQASRGSLISSRLISITAAYSASLSALRSFGFCSQVFCSAPRGWRCFRRRARRRRHRPPRAAGESSPWPVVRGGRWGYL